jgi:DNA-binding transcriptional regulator YiaG
MHNAGMVTAEKVRAARSNLGETQAKFGSRFGVDQSTVHRWETTGVSDRGTARVLMQRFLEEIGAEPREAAE